MKRLVIAIDGPAGAGKSTVAQMVASKLGYTYIDTGAMYRAVAWKALTTGVEDETAKIVEIADEMNIELKFKNGKTEVIVDGYNVSIDIRTPEVTALVAKVAKIGGVRESLVAAQQKMAEAGGVVMDGRDICSCVLPDADVKLFLTASIDERARRRYKEMQSKGYVLDLAQLKAEIAERDLTDSQREISPLTQAPDAELLDTTALTLDEVIDKVLALCRVKENAV